MNIWLNTAISYILIYLFIKLTKIVGVANYEYLYVLNYVFFRAIKDQRVTVDIKEKPVFEERKAHPVPG